MKKILLKENERIIAKNVLGAFFVRGGALVISLLSTPAFLSYFQDNKAVLGVWYALLSVLTWFMTFDLGIGNGVRTELVKAFAKDDRERGRRILSAGIFSNLVTTLILTLIGIVLLSCIDLNALFNIPEDAIAAKTLYRATMIVFFSIMLRFFLTIVSAIFYALQKSFVNNLLSLGCSILQLLFLLCFRFSSPERALLYLAIGYGVTSNLPILLAGVAVLCTKLRNYRPAVRYIDRMHIGRVMGVGTVFFVCQIAFMLIMNTNEILITNLFGPAYTTDYTFYLRLSNLVASMVSLAMTPICSVVTKAIAEKNYIWLQKLYRILKGIGILAVGFEFLLIPFLQFIMDIWLGENSIPVVYSTAYAFACLGGVYIYTNVLSTIVCGIPRMRLQTICYIAAVVVRFVLLYLLAPGGQWDVIIWTAVIVLVPYCILEQISLDRFFRRKIEESKKASV